ncbi:flagellar hook-associated protein FlgL [Klenkia sp. LSe6-5]|uniref:Flagellar hook-associated protein FlgL n=1 Tax=Klenkia sesuvii TaxID=3103137 RepID=A0ABU8DPB3_9ACTN
MRITNRMIADSNLRGMNGNLAGIAKLNEQISSGRAVTRPSDNPSGTSTAMRTRQDLTANTQYAANIGDAATTLAAADTALGTMGEMLLRVRNLTTAAASNGSQTPGAYEAMATEVDSIREGMIALANRTVNGRPVFGGVTSGAAAYSAAGAFLGRADTDVTTRISDAETITVGVPGPTAFGDAAAGEEDVFALLSRISGLMTATPPGDLTNVLDALDVAQQRMSASRSVVGMQVNRIESVKAVNADQALALTGQLSEVEDVEPAKAYLELNVLRNGYQAALTATSQSIQTSLVDFIR